MKICLTGATGFIGKNLLEALKNKKDTEVIALSRKISPQMDNAKKGNITWRRCNGFSLLDTEKAMEGCDVLIYLIHSMLPSTALTQGSFGDFDLYLADNFAKAAKKNGIKKIIYLSGIIPKDHSLSEHLESRLEVEKVLSQYNNDLTVLRSGLIIGKNGSSFRILEKLIKRLPVLICPAWTQSKGQPIDIEDVMATFDYCLNNISELEDVYDIGGPDTLSYREMLSETARALGKKRPMINIPLFSPGLSKLWVSKVSSIHPMLVYPLVESLKHEMVTDPDKKLTISGHSYKSFQKALSEGLTNEDDGFIRSIIDYNANINFRWLENVTSIQRVAHLKDKTAEGVAKAYFDWLPQFLRPLIQVSQHLDGRVNFKCLGLITLLILEKCRDRSNSERVFYYIRGGILARKTTLNGRLEFRPIPAMGLTLIALLDFRPSLPWFIYKYTQALFHLLVMKSFARHLMRINP